MWRVTYTGRYQLPNIWKRSTQETFGLNRDEVGSGGNYTNTIFVICRVRLVLLGLLNEESWDELEVRTA
jgi:hypothetical protein